MTALETSDAQLLDLLRRHGAMSVAEIAEATHVTATAVRQRLTRLMGQGLVDRESAKASRGRPSHRYSPTEKAKRQAGSNFFDLALVLWQEIRAVKDESVRKGLLQRLAQSMARLYAGRIEGSTPVARVESLQAVFASRNLPLEFDSHGGVPTLTVIDCPYPVLAEQDRGICAVERMLFAEVLEQPVKLAQCRLEGHACCQFVTN